MTLVEDMRISAYTLSVTVAYTALALVAPLTAAALTLPCCCALVLPCLVHLRRRSRGRPRRDRPGPA